MDPSGRTYEDFVPPHRMVREPPTHTLSVDLSTAGFKKEHIRVQLVHSHRRLIVRGERPVAGNRWSRFRLEFKLLDDCDTKGVQARFEKGVVQVTMEGEEIIGGGWIGHGMAARRDEHPVRRLARGLSKHRHVVLNVVLVVVLLWLVVFANDKPSGGGRHVKND